MSYYCFRSIYDVKILVRDRDQFQRTNTKTCRIEKQQQVTCARATAHTAENSKTFRYPTVPVQIRSAALKAADDTFRIHKLSKLTQHLQTMRTIRDCCLLSTCKRLGLATILLNLMPTCTTLSLYEHTYTNNCSTHKHNGRQGSLMQRSLAIVVVAIALFLSVGLVAVPICSVSAASFISTANCQVNMAADNKLATTWPPARGSAGPHCRLRRDIRRDSYPMRKLVDSSTLADSVAKDTS